jgi:hypothetical protein
MPYSTTQRGKRLFSITVNLLITIGMNAAPVFTAGIKPLSLSSAGAAPFSGQLFFHSGSSRPHILWNSPLYKGDTVLLNGRENPGAVSGFIRREKNGDLVIVIPNAVREKYKIRFFDDDDHFLFEVRQIRDPLLIVEKYNFQHTGLFQYELYRENLLIERSTFLIHN